MSDSGEPEEAPPIDGGRSIELDPEPTDAIQPTVIHHLVDEFRAGGQLIQHYNYFDYEFERDGLSCQARAYVETIDEVALMGLSPKEGGHRKVPNSAFRDDILQFLKRRFQHITELGEAGYETLWRHPDSPMIP